MSGNTGIVEVNEDESTTIFPLLIAAPGDKVKGLDDNLQDATCEVQSIGYWGPGELYGNYTSNHFVYASSRGGIVEHGEVGDYSSEDQYVLLSSCPLVLDESGGAFTPIDTFVWWIWKLMPPVSSLLRITFLFTTLSVICESISCSLRGVRICQF